MDVCIDDPRHDQKPPDVNRVLPGQRPRVGYGRDAATGNADIGP